MAGEMGCNTNMAKDKNVGNGLLYGEGQPQVTGTTEDQHFTLLSYTSFGGKPILMVVIIAGGSDLTVTEVYRMNLDVEWVGEDDDIPKNMGPGKRYPGGPRCLVKGVKVPCFMTKSESGGMSSEILANTLRYVDKLGLFPREEGKLDPFFLCDGHGSRLELPFLEYIILIPARDSHP
jgi:hypothetical protein